MSAAVPFLSGSEVGKMWRWTIRRRIHATDGHDTGRKLPDNREDLNAATAAYRQTLARENERDRFDALQEAAAAYLAAEDKVTDGAAKRGLAENRVAIAIELAPKFVAVKREKYAKRTRSILMSHVGVV